MSESKGFWNNATVVAVVAGIGVPAILGVAHYIGLTIPSVFAWLHAVGVFWVADVTLSRWAYWLWLAFTAIITLLVVLQIRYIWSQSGEAVKPATKPTSVAAYRTDIFFGFRWRWAVYASGRVGNVTMYCPKCDYELSAKDFERTHAYGRFLCRCEHCPFAHQIDAAEPREMHDKVEKAAERKIRTGEWRRVVG